MSSSDPKDRAADAAAATTCPSTSSGLGVEVDRHIDALVAAAPPLTPAQIDRIRGLLAPAATQDGADEVVVPRQRPKRSSAHSLTRQDSATSP